MKSVLVATLVMVVIDLTYGPFAFPQTLEPGGKRDLHPFTLAAVEVTRILGFAAVIWIGVRYVLRAPVSLAEAIWMTLPYAVALVLLLASSVALSGNSNDFEIASAIRFARALLR